MTACLIYIQIFVGIEPFGIEVFHVIYTADFSITTIKKLIRQGERDTEKFFTGIDKY
jgi:hypothetical protein